MLLVKIAVELAAPCAAAGPRLGSPPRHLRGSRALHPTPLPGFAGPADARNRGDGQAKVRRQHADDREHLLVERDRAPDDRRIGLKPPPPERLADDGEMRVGGGVVARLERAAEGGRDAERFEQVGRCRGSLRLQTSTGPTSHPNRPPQEPGARSVVLEPAGLGCQRDQSSQAMPSMREKSPRLSVAIVSPDSHAVAAIRVDPVNRGTPCRVAAPFT